MQMKLNFESPQGRNQAEGYKAPEAALTTASVLGSIHATMTKFSQMGRNDWEIPTLMQLANDLQAGKITANEAESKRASMEKGKDAYDYN